MALQSEPVAHPNLVGGSDTTLHSHAGGGSGPTIKAGTITTDGGGAATVSFNTAFPDTNYAILLTPQNPSDAVMASYNSKAVGGFGVETHEDKGQSKGSVVVDWIATPYSNP
jgi:hypothetical protein